MRIFRPMARDKRERRRSKMVFLAGADAYRDLAYGDDCPSHLITEKSSMCEYRFGRTQEKRVRARALIALGRVKGYLWNMIEAAVRSKLRRMERELELQGFGSARSDFRQG